jgi:hypothetical protein
MSSKGGLTKGAQHHAKDAVQSARPWMEQLARLGYATEGALYSLIGLQAAGAALAKEGAVCLQGDVLNRLSGLPFRGAFGEDDDVVFPTRVAALLGEYYPGVREGALVGSDLVCHAGLLGERLGQAILEGCIRHELEHVGREPWAGV